MAIKSVNKQLTNEKPKPSISSNNGNNGLIKIDTGKLHLPDQLTEGQEETKFSFWHTILVIFILALTFIGFISILISRMLAK